MLFNRILNNILKIVACFKLRLKQRVVFGDALEKLSPLTNRNGVRGGSDRWHLLIVVRLKVHNDSISGSGGGFRRMLQIITEHVDNRRRRIR